MQIQRITDFAAKRYLLLGSHTTDFSQKHQPCNWTILHRLLPYSLILFQDPFLSINRGCILLCLTNDIVGKEHFKQPFVPGSEWTTRNTEEPASCKSVFGLIRGGDLLPMGICAIGRHECAHGGMINCSISLALRCACAYKVCLGRSLKKGKVGKIGVFLVCHGSRVFSRALWLG